MIRAVRLETAEGEHVHDGRILAFVTGPPRIVLWGLRIFLLHSEPEVLTDPKAAEALARLDAPAVYRETFYTHLLPECA